MSDDFETPEELLVLDKFVVAGRSFDNTATEDLRINPAELTSEFVSHPERFAKWATLYELAVDTETRLKDELDRVYARMDHHTRIQGKDAGVKLTETMVENTVITSAEYVDALDMYHEAKKTAGLLKAARDAMIHRRDMLIQLGATYRAEGNADISVREDTARNILRRTSNK
jgi:hypothetical protein